VNEQAPQIRTVFDLFDASVTAVIAVDETAAIRYLNGRAVEVFGYLPAELLGQPVEVLLPQARADAHAALRDTYLEAPISRHIDVRDLKGRRKDGTEFAAEISLTPVVTGSGPWVAASVLDISLRKESEARVRRQSRGYLALAKVNEAVARAEHEDELFRKVCHIAVVHGGFIGAWVMTADIDDDLHMRASAGPLATRLAVASAEWPSVDDFLNDQVRDIRRDGGVLPGGVRSLDTEEACFTNDFELEPLDPRLRFLTDWARSGAALPLGSHGRAVASLSLYADRAGVFDDNLRGLLTGAAENISLALDRFRARIDLDRTLAQRTQLLRRLVDVQERERARIAADVHDEPVQALAAVDLRLGLLRRRLEEAAPDLVPDLAQIHTTVTSVSDGLRGLLFELEPVSESAHLTDLLEDAAGHIFELTPVAWSIANEPDPRELELSVATRTQAVRIAKEAMVNVAKHAQAQTVTIRVVLEDDGVTVTVTDDGVGLPPGVRSSPPGHRGISGMLDRAEVSGGSLFLDTHAGGTTISVWLPGA
jgi:PAS domain S-box-containing protein